MYMGEKGYRKETENILNAVQDFKKKLKAIPDLEIVGNPFGSVLAIKLKKQPERIYQVVIHRI